MQRDSWRAPAAAERCCASRTVDSIYLGGGTPGVLSPALLGELARNPAPGICASTPQAEITLECAPGQLDDEALAAMLDFGVNRISFGVQSLVDREAAATGRFHTRAVVLNDLERVRAAGVRRLSIDLIAGMPYQTADSWQESLAVLSSTGVEHASVYMLEIDDDSRLGRELLAGGTRYHAAAVPNEELTADLYEAAIAVLSNNGLPQYEISNFAGPSAQSRHNLKYWQRQPYLGFGLDAHSMVRTQSGSALRFANTALLPAYLDGSAFDDVRSLSPSEELEEAWFLGLRLRQGVAWHALAAEFGREPADAFRPLVSELSELGLVSNEAGVVRLTRRGVLFSNDVFAHFLGTKEVTANSMTPETIDLRSDTITRPTPAMRAAMAEAEVGDDVYGEDPTVNRLEARAAEIFGREAAMFVPTGTMGNQIAIRMHTEHGQEVICESRGHLVDWEMAMVSAFSGCQLRTVVADHGILTWPLVEKVISTGQHFRAKTGLISLENTHNLAGGTVMPLEVAEEIWAGAADAGLPVHLDGARIFNAATALATPVDRLTSGFASVMFCLSKGLCAPVGSMLVSSRKHIERHAISARRLAEVCARRGSWPPPASLR